MDLLRKKWFWGALLGLAVIALVVANMINMNKAAAVTTTEVVEGTIAEQIYTNGKLEPAETTRVFAPETGVAGAVKVKLGDNVSKGQILLTLNMDSVKEQLEKERLNLELAESERLAAKKQHFEKYKEAMIADPDQKIEAPDLSSYDLRIRTSQLTIASMEKQLQHQTVSAPVDGVVTSLSVLAGQALAEGSEILTLADMSGLKVKANLNELDAGKVQLGMKAVVTGESFDGTYDGKITYLAPTAELANATAKDPTVEMKVSLDKISPQLRAGYNATVEMEIPDKQRLLVPIGAIQYEGSQAIVFKVADGKAVRVPVTTGKEGEEQIEIVSGVARGDIIVAEGGDKLQDGAKVKVQ
ncbi:efflux RND transporter periplasmic adaptor subunit [Paenibacillus macerans]|uniref:efflux RND transporter periplasmic adaptor subunit n=1 Tax=Paenibacillus macerans TaxID=44252 RepID=UPI003D31B913